MDDGGVVPTEIGERAQQLVYVLRNLPSHQAMVAIIKCNLSLDFCAQNVKTSATSVDIPVVVRHCCELVCKCLLESVLKVNMIFFSSPNSSQSLITILD